MWKPSCILQKKDQFQHCFNYVHVMLNKQFDNLYDSYTVYYNLLYVATVTVKPVSPQTGVCDLNKQTVALNPNVRYMLPTRQCLGQPLGGILRHPIFNGSEKT